MFCVKCGTKINEDAMFCPKCGTKAPGAPSPATATGARAPVQKKAAPGGSVRAGAASVQRAYPARTSGSQPGNMGAAQVDYTRLRGVLLAIVIINYIVGISSILLGILSVIVHIAEFSLNQLVLNLIDDYLTVSLIGSGLIFLGGGIGSLIFAIKTQNRKPAAPLFIQIVSIIMIVVTAIYYPVLMSIGNKFNIIFDFLSVPNINTTVYIIPMILILVWWIASLVLYTLYFRNSARVRGYFTKYDRPLRGILINRPGYSNNVAASYSYPPRDYGDGPAVDLKNTAPSAVDPYEGSTVMQGAASKPTASAAPNSPADGWKTPMDLQPVHTPHVASSAPAAVKSNVVSAPQPASVNTAPQPAPANVNTAPQPAAAQKAQPYSPYAQAEAETTKNNTGIWKIMMIVGLIAAVLLIGLAVAMILIEAELPFIIGVGAAAVVVAIFAVISAIKHVKSL